MHGYPDNHHLYDRVVPYLRGRHVVVFDFLGWGNSDKPKGYDYTFDNQKGDLDAVIAGLGVDRVVLVVHEASGPAGINWAVEHPQQVAAIVRKMLRPKSSQHNILITRADERIYRAVRRASAKAKFYPLAGAIAIRRNHIIAGKGTILTLSAGTSDIPVAEEAAVTAKIMGNRVETVYDVGVAGLHRLMEHHEKLTSARVIICVAGMEGALPSVVAGLVAVPVIAVPTSTGYGASFGGLTALLAMLNSCASNISVVNIDNGFGAGCVASVINRL